MLFILISYLILFKSFCFLIASSVLLSAVKNYRSTALYFDFLKEWKAIQFTAAMNPHVYKKKKNWYAKINWITIVVIQKNAVKNADFRKSESRTRALLPRAWLLERMLLFCTSFYEFFYNSYWCCFMHIPKH